MSNILTVTITTRTAAFGESKTQERSAIALALQKVAQNVGSGAALSANITDSNGAVIGTAAWQAGALNP